MEPLGTNSWEEFALGGALGGFLATGGGSAATGGGTGADSDGTNAGECFFFASIIGITPAAGITGLGSSPNI